MLELLNTLTVDQIILYLVMFMLAFKEVVNFASWFKEKYDLKFNKDYNKKEEAKKIENLYEEVQKQNNVTQTMCKDLEDKLITIDNKFSERVNYMEDKIDKITTSNMHDIKGWIVDKHHTLMKQKSIDDFTMDILEKRYSDYVALGGNSYIASLMGELRNLSHGTKEE